MDKLERALLDEAVSHFADGLKLLHRLIGRLDAAEDFRPALRVLPMEIPFPGKIEKTDAGTSAEEEKGFVYFSDKEIQQMPKNIQNLIILNKKRCRIRKHPSGRRTFTYEIRYRRDGYDVSACGVSIELAKEKMLEKLSHAVKREDRTVVPTTFKAFALYYFENFRKEKVSPQTYKKDMLRLKSYLFPHFKETPIKRIMPADCKALYKEIQEEGKGKTASEVYSMMSILFKGAIIHGIIQRSPLDLVLYQAYVSESGVALTKDEEKRLFAHVEDDPLLSLAFAVVLYTGLRPNEIPTARIKGDFIVAKNSKRKNGKIESKKIPIIGKLRPYVGEELPTLPSVKVLRPVLREVLSDHKLYDLRTTFYTRCDECGVAAPARDEFVGHSSGTLTDTYRDLSDEYLLQEGKKLDLW